MPGLTLQTDGFVLERHPPADAYEGLCLFSPEHGALRVLQRVPRKPAPNHSALDLFDQASVLIESSNQGRSWFVRETRLLTRFAALASSYEALRRASSLALLVARNPVQPESRPAVAALLGTALAALAAGRRPDLVYLKALYVFGRDEGYPVRQEWLEGLTETMGALAAGLLGRPLDGQEAAPAQVDGLIRSLEAYLRSSAEFLVD